MIDGDLEQMLYCDIEWTGEAIGNIIKTHLTIQIQGENLYIVGTNARYD